MVLLPSSFTQKQLSGQDRDVLLNCIFGLARRRYPVRLHCFPMIYGYALQYRSAHLCSLPETLGCVEFEFLSPDNGCIHQETQLWFSRIGSSVCPLAICELTLVNVL